MPYTYVTEINTPRTAQAIPAGALGCWVDTLGAGAGGGRGYAAGASARGGGGGGGGGARCRWVWIPASAFGGATTYSTVIGAAGAEQADGGDTVFTLGSIEIRAGGGKKGGNGTSTAVGAGGAGGTATITGVTGTGYSGGAGGAGGNYVTNSNATGAAGSNGSNGSGAGGGGGGGLDAGGNSASWTTSFGGKGGDSDGAGGAQTNATTVTNAGQSVLNGKAGGGGSGGALSSGYTANPGGKGGAYGAGGGGSSATNGTQKAGGAGAAGWALVVWQMPVESGDIPHEYIALGDANPNTPWGLNWTHISDGGADAVVIIGVNLSIDTTTGLTKNNTTPTVTYDGTPALLLTGSDVGDNSSGAAYLYAVWNPSAGAKTVAVSWSTSGSPTAAAGSSVSYTGAAGVRNAWQKPNAAATNPTITVASATTRRLVHYGVNHAAFGGSYSQNQLFQATVDSRSAVLGDAAGGASVTFSYTATSSVYTHLVIELSPVTETGQVWLRSQSRGNAVTGSSTTLAASDTIQLDTTDTKTLAFVLVSMSLSSSTSVTCAVTFGGVAMTQLGSIEFNAGAGSALACYYLWNPPTGSNAIAMTVGGVATKYKVSVVAMVYQNVGDGARTPGQNSGIYSDITVTPAPGPGDRVVGAVVNSSAFSPSSYDEVYRDFASVSGLGDAMLVHETFGTGSTFTMSASGAAGSPVAFALILTATALLYGTAGMAAKPALAALGATHGQNGSIAAAIGRALFSGTATEEQSGAVSVVLQALRMAAGGAHTQAGAATAAARPALMAAAGTHAQSGTAGPVLQRAVIASAGSHAQSGTATTTAQKATAAATGAHTQAGTLSVAALPAVMSSAGGQGTVALIGATLQRTAAAAAGIQTQAGTLAAATKTALAALSAATGESSITATLGSALRAVTAAFSGPPPTLGTVSARTRIPAFTGAGGQALLGALAGRLRQLLGGFTATKSEVIDRVGATTALSTTIAIPTHAAGDLILMFAYRAAGAWPYPALPSGWTEILSGASGSNSQRVAYRIASGPGTTSGTWTGADGLICHVYRTPGRWKRPTAVDDGPPTAAATLQYPDHPARPGGTWFVRFGGDQTATDMLAETPAGWTPVTGNTNLVRSMDTNALVTGSADDVGDDTQHVNAAASWRTVTVSVAAAVADAPGTPARMVWDTIPAGASVATLSGETFNLTNDMPAELDGIFAQAPYTITQLKYPASRAVTSIATGVTMLDAWVRATPGPKIVLAHDQGATVATRWMLQYGADPTAPPANQLTFILTGNPNSSARGWAAATNHTDIDGTTAQFTPTTTPWPILDVHIRYDGYCDWPADDTNELAIRNANLGKASRHNRYHDVDVYDPTHTAWTVGNTTHVLTAPDNLGLPYLDRRAAPACLTTAAINAAETAYQRPGSDPTIPVVQPANPFERHLMETAGLGAYITTP